MTARRVSFKVHLPFQVAVACWIDLLGYGKSLSDAQFNPLNPLAVDAISRLRRFHELVADHSRRRFPTLVMNDGAVAYRDLTWNTRWTTFEFLSDAFSLFSSVNAEERARQLPGARMVIASGFRLRGRRAGKDDRGSRIRSVLQRLEAGSLTRKEAVTRAARINVNFDQVPQLQANFAFTKAYLAEQSGRSGGFEGPRCFVDMALFETPPPDWLEIGGMIPWRHNHLDLAGTFAPLHSLPAAKQNETKGGVTIHGGPEGVRDAVQVAQFLSQDVEVLAALRSARLQSWP